MLPGQRGRIGFQRVALDHREPPGGCRHQVLQGLHAPRVAFHGDHMGGARVQQRAGQRTGPGANLEDERALQRPRRAGDPVGQVEIGEEVLAERSARAQMMPRDHLPQRRQRLDRGGDIAVIAQGPVGGGTRVVMIPS